jgi:hypothetical protein
VCARKCGLRAVGLPSSGSPPEMSFAKPHETGRTWFMTARRLRLTARVRACDTQKGTDPGFPAAC